MEFAWYKFYIIILSIMFVFTTFFLFCLIHEKEKAFIFLLQNMLEILYLQPYLKGRHLSNKVINYLLKWRLIQRLQWTDTKIHWLLGPTKQRTKPRSRLPIKKTNTGSRFQNRSEFLLKNQPKLFVLISLHTAVDNKHTSKPKTTIKRPCKIC